MDQAKVRDLKLVYDFSWIARSPRAGSTSCRSRRSCAASWFRSCVPRRPTKWQACGRNWPRCGPTWRSCSTPTCRTGPRWKPTEPVRGSYDDWSPTPETAGRVTASRIDTEDRDDTDYRTDESPIIDVPEEPHPPEFEWVPPASPGGAHRRAAEAERVSRRYAADEPQAWTPPPTPATAAATVGAASHRCPASHRERAHHRILLAARHKNPLNRLSPRAPPEPQEPAAPA